MSVRAGSKQGRPGTKPGAKGTGKDSTKGDKPHANLIEIVPGKYNENDWLSLLENDDTEDYIADIFETIWTETSKQVQQIYIRKQLLPFTLMMTENALSNVIQWAFLERDEAKPASGTFWTEDSEPIPCTLDNWAEGVVPACREERPQRNEETPISIDDRPTSAPVNMPIPKTTERVRHSSASSSVMSSIETPSSNATNEKSLKIPKLNKIQQKTKQEQSTTTDSNVHTLSQKDSSTDHDSSRSTFEQKPYCHNILVIHTQPPQLEPLATLFNPENLLNNSLSTHLTSATASTKRRQQSAQKRFPSQVGSDSITTITNISGTTTSKSFKKSLDSKLFDEQKVEDAISKAPTATHSTLKSILSRPPGYRELELDENGNVIAIVKLDPDKQAPRNIHVKCDIVKSRKPTVETRPPVLKSAPPIVKKRSETKTESTKITIPEQSTDVGDLIQPVPGVVYEDTRLRKGDPRRYQTSSAKYTNFHDEIRQLKPIVQRGDLTVLKVARNLLLQTIDNNEENQNAEDSQIPKLHRLPRIPPIISGSNTSA